jgi:phage baseplate assembly protein W
MATINFYKDLPLDFIPHPVSGDVRPIVNELAIKRSIINLINTRKGSRPFYPEYGCIISNFLFSNEDVFTKSSMIDSIYDALSRFEPRIDVIEIRPRFEDNGIIIDIQYRIKNMNIISSISTSIKRVT